MFEVECWASDEGARRLLHIFLRSAPLRRAPACKRAMFVQYDITHTTTYRYAEPVSFGEHR